MCVCLCVRGGTSYILLLEVKIGTYIVNLNKSRVSM